MQLLFRSAFFEQSILVDLQEHLFSFSFPSLAFSGNICALILLATSSNVISSVVSSPIPTICACCSKYALYSLYILFFKPLSTAFMNIPWPNSSVSNLIFNFPFFAMISSLLCNLMISSGPSRIIDLASAVNFIFSNCSISMTSPS
eukprot:UN25212